jgi:mono/diheme cytochrome c family protein
MVNRPPRAAAPRLGLGLAVLLGAALLVLPACSKGTSPPGAGGEAPGAVPDGAALFNFHCARCHGDKGSGTPQGPPLVNPIYEPSHHSDAAFFAAVADGVRAHHWRFGDMPRIGGLTHADVTAIIAYVRAQQRQAGIQ